MIQKNLPLNQNKFHIIQHYWILIAAEYRLFTQHQMREQTEKKCKNLSEIKKKEELEKREEDYKTNRLMAQIFNRVCSRKYQVKYLETHIFFYRSCKIEFFTTKQTCLIQ